MANSFITDQLENNWITEKMSKQKVVITWKRYNELTMLENRNFILEKKVEELLIKISELQEQLKMKITPRTKKAVKSISAVHFK